jgi:hypothetical protein
MLGKLPLSEVDSWDLETVYKFGDLLDMRSDQEAAYQSWSMRDFDKPNKTR